MKKLKECGGFFFFNNLIATNVLQLNEVGFCKRLVCAAFVLGAVSSLVLFKVFFERGVLDI